LVNKAVLIAHVLLNQGLKLETYRLQLGLACVQPPTVGGGAFNEARFDPPDGATPQVYKPGFGLGLELSGGLCGVVQRGAAFGGDEYQAAL
jgi:hypothetical protein